MARTLNPVLRPKYRAAVEQRVYTDMLLVGIPDGSVVPQRSQPQSSPTTATLSQPITVSFPMPEMDTKPDIEMALPAAGV